MKEGMTLEEMKAFVEKRRKCKDCANMKHVVGEGYKCKQPETSSVGSQVITFSMEIAPRRCTPYVRRQKNKYQAASPETMGRRLTMDGTELAS